jgi:tetratricopeptide (TPR) repeat protein
LIGTALLTSAQCRIWKDDLTLWSAAIEHDPESAAMPHLLVGADYLTHGDKEHALEHFKLAQRTALELIERVQSLFFLARLDALAGKRAHAIGYCRQIAHIDPRDSISLVWASDCAADVGDPGLGLYYIEKALPLDPGQAVIYRAARLNQDTGNYLRARDLSAIVFKMQPSDKKTLLLLAESNEALGHRGEALKYFNAVKIRFPDDKEANEGLRRIHAPGSLSVTR